MLQYMRVLILAIILILIYKLLIHKINVDFKSILYFIHFSLLSNKLT